MAPQSSYMAQIRVAKAMHSAVLYNDIPIPSQQIPPLSNYRAFVS